MQLEEPNERRSNVVLFICHVALFKISSLTNRIQQLPGSSPRWIIPTGFLETVSSLSSLSLRSVINQCLSCLTMQPPQFVVLKMVDSHRARNLDC